MKKRWLSMVLTLCLALTLLPVSALAAASTDYTLTGNQADDTLAVARAQIGRTGSELGYNADWCAYFVSWAGRTAGADYPSTNMANPRTLTHWFVNNAKGTFYYFRDKNYDSLIENHPNMKNKNLCVKSDRSAFIPQKGDIIIYLWSNASSSINWSHVGLVESYGNGKVNTIEGNVGGNGYKANKVDSRTRNFSTNTDVVGIVRPNYTNADGAVSQNESIAYLDLNGFLDGVYYGNIYGYGTVDIYINGNLVADDVTDYYASWPIGTKYEIKDIEPADGCTFHDTFEGSLSGIIASGTTVVSLYLTSGPVYYLDLNGFLDGTYYGNISGYGTVDIYIDGVLLANDVTDYYASWPAGTKYEIKDIKPAEGCKFHDVFEGELSGVVGSKTTVVSLYFSSVPVYYLDLNGFLDGQDSFNITGYGTADVYIGGVLRSNACSDYCAVWPVGTEYEIRNIQALPGYTYNGVQEGSISGIVGEADVNVKLSFSKSGNAATISKVIDVHFEPQTIYYQGQFTDVPANQWYTDGVASAYEFGLMKGNDDGTFNPYGDVTLAEAITMAARIHSIYTTGSESFVQTGTWYQVYLDYALENGIISRAYYNSDVTHRATRAQFAEIFANSLPDEALAAMNAVADGAIPDVGMSDSFARYVYKLYRAGILTGGDANGTFSPQTYITRAESAAIVSRMADSDNRVSFSL